MSDSRQLQVALVGCGTIALCHAVVLARDSRVARLHLCDPNLEQIQRLCHQLEQRGGARVPLTQVVGTGIPAADAVVICTPHYSHSELMMMAVNQGAHVLLEKPLAITPAAIDDMVECEQQAARAGLITSCIFQHRYAPLAQVLQAACRSGAVGAIRQVRLYGRCTRRPEYYQADGWRGTWQGEGGGVLINQMIHLLDLATACLGGVAWVRAQIANRHLRQVIEVEDTAQASGQFVSGPHFELDIANDQTTEWLNVFHLVSDRGDVLYTPDGGGAFLPGTSHPQADQWRAQAAVADELSQAAEVVAKREYGDLHARQIHDWLHAVSQQTTPQVSIAEAALANRLVLACYQSARLGKKVFIDKSFADNYRPPSLCDTTGDPGVMTVSKS